MRKLLLIGFVGLLAQFVDGALGMAYGVTSTTVLLTAGLAPAVVSASVHMAELGTTLASGAAHWRFGNVEWRTVALMTFPGFAGAFAGAVFLSNLSAEVAEPFIAVFLFSLGVYILIRFSRPLRHKSEVERRPLKAIFLSPLGLFAGFMDAAGGGGWGPIGTPALLSSGRMEPRKVVGSVDTGEFLVSLGASLGFLVALPLADLNFAYVAALLAGGLIAAPLAAYLVRLLPAAVLGTAVGGVIVLTNAKTFGEGVGIEGGALATAYFALAVIALGSLALAVARHRRDRGLEPQPAG